MSAAIAKTSIGNIQHLDPDERQALISEIRDWLRNDSVATQSSPQAKSPSNDASASTVSADKVFPRPWTLWARVPQVKADWTQAPEYVYGVPYGAAKSMTPAFYPNPDSSLFTGSVTFNFAQAFLSISDRTTLCKVLTTVNVGEEGDPCYWSTLLGMRPRDRAERFLAAFSATATAAQNPRFSQGLIPLPGTVAYDKSYSGTVTGTFTPKNIFRTANDLNSVYGVFDQSKADKSTTINYGSNGVGELLGALPCSEISSKCIKSLAYGWKQQFLEVVLPTVEVKAVTPSDLYKTGTNTFVQPPTQLTALYEFSATWDLTNWVPNASTRANAVTTLKSAYNMQHPGNPPQSANSASSENQKWKAQVAWYCLQLVSHPEIAENDGWWERFQDALLK